MADTLGTIALQRSGRFTLADWRTWPEGERWELIDGTAYNMSPAPRVPHQVVAGKIYALLDALLDGKACQPFVAPVDVFLPSQEGDDTVVQPDVFVVCDPTKIEDDGIKGAPDFVVEVLSDSTAFKDLGVKKALYERSGVREYWLIHPYDGSVTVYVLHEGAWAPAKGYRAGDTVASAVISGFTWTARKA